MTKLTQDRFQSRSDFERYERHYDNAKLNGWTDFIDDAIPVMPKLKNFFLEFRHKKPMAVAVPDPTRAGASAQMPNGHFITVYSRLGIAFAEAPEIVVGELAVTTTDKSGEVYTVRSDTINNERYKPHNNLYNQKSSKNFVPAIKTAVQHIKPISFEDVMDNSKPALSVARGQINEKAAAKVNSATAMTMTDKFKEVMHMIECGYRPITPAFQNAFSVLNEEGEELKRLLNYAPTKVFVWAQTNRVIYQYENDPVQHVANSVDEVPENIRNKVMVLQIGNKHSAIVDVGIKVDDTKYWVFL
jgi:hypothetical protein